MRETKAAAPSCVEGPHRTATTTCITPPGADLDGDAEGASSGVRASEHRAAARSEDEITLRCSVEQSERLRAVAAAAREPLPVVDATFSTAEPLPPAPAHDDEACPSQWNADEEITLDAPAPVSTPTSWPELDDPASPEPSDAASTAMDDAAWPELDAALSCEPSDAAPAVPAASVPPPLPPRARATGASRERELPLSFPRGASALVMPTPTPLRRLPTRPRGRATPVVPRPTRPGVAAAENGDDATELEHASSRVPDAWTVAGIWTVAVALLAVLALVVR